MKFLKYISLLLCIVGFQLCVNAQMTMGEMNNFKKNDKARQKRMKQKGPTVNTKKRLSSPRKTRQKKSLFSKKKFNVAYYFREEDFLTWFS